MLGIGCQFSRSSTSDEADVKGDTAFFQLGCQVVSGRAGVAVGEDQDPFRPPAPGQFEHVREDAIDVRSIGVLDGLTGEGFSGPEGSDNGAEPEQADLTLSMGSIKRAAKQRQHIRHGPADVEVDMSHFLGFQTAAAMLNAVLEENGLQPGDLFPCELTAITQLGEDGLNFAVTLNGAPGTRTVRSGRAQDSCPSQDPLQRSPEFTLNFRSWIEKKARRIVPVVTTGDRDWRRRPAFHNFTNDLTKRLVGESHVFVLTGRGIPGVISQQHDILADSSVAGFETLCQGAEHIEVGRALMVLAVEQINRAAFGITGALGQGCRTIGPPRRRRQERCREGVPWVEFLKKPGVNGIGKLLAKHGIDDRVEDKIVEGRGAGEQSRVSEDDVIKFVHHQQKQGFIGCAVIGNEVGVQMKSGLMGALHAGGRAAVTFDNVHELEQPVHLKAGGWEHVEDSFPQMTFALGASGLEK